MLGPPGSRAAARHRAHSWGGSSAGWITAASPSSAASGLSPAGWAALSPRGLGGGGEGGPAAVAVCAHGTAAAHPSWCTHCSAPTALQAPARTHGTAPIAVHPLHGTLVVQPVQSPRGAAPIAARPRRCTRCSTHRGARAVPPWVPSTSPAPRHLPQQLAGPQIPRPA